jgi:cell division septation protein DedD
MTHLHPFLVSALALPLIMTGCGSGEEIVEQAPPPAEPHAQSFTPAQEAPPRKAEFETRTDTVTATHAGSLTPAGKAVRGAQVRYMVQIGAFKDPKNASAIQAETRRRYHVPVLNDFHSARSLYQIRLGFFESLESASAFRQKMLDEYPLDYKDSWVVQLKR